MLKIFTDSRMSNKEYLIDIEAEFNADEPMIEELYSDKISSYILQKMEGMTSRKGKYIDAKFGTVSIMDISTGCKALLLCCTRNEEFIINVDEMGNNAIKILAELSKNKDIEVVTHRVLKYFSNDFACYVNNEYCVGEDISYALAEILNEEVF